MTFCAVRSFLNLPCPGCGLLHALWSLVHLDLPMAFADFPIWPAFILFLLFRRRRHAGELFLVVLFSQWAARIVLKLFSIDS